MPDDPGQDFGAYLRSARERKGVTLGQIASSTRISKVALQALERNDVSRLPGGIFTRSFVRAYAEETGLDPEDTVARFLKRFPATESVGTEPTRDVGLDNLGQDVRTGGAHVMRRLAWALPLLLVLGYFGLSGRVPALRDGWLAPKTLPVPPAAQRMQPPTPEVPPLIPAEFGAVDVVGPAPQDATAASLAAVDAPIAMPTASTANTPPGTFRLSLAPSEACWISLTRDDGTVVFSGVLQAADRRDFDLSGELSLKVGDAAAFGYAINGERGRPLGGAGEVVTVRITEENLRTYLAAR